MRRIVLALVFALVMAPALGASADDIGGYGFSVPTPQAPQAVSAPPPPYVELESRRVAAGIGFSWGSGRLSFDGRPYDFSVKGVSLGDVGVAQLVGEGEVEHLDRIEQFEGRYLAVEAALAAGKGSSRVVLRNEHGVVIRLSARLSGVALTLGAEGVQITLR